MKKPRIKVWERFAYWTSDHNWDYRWWPVVTSMVDRRARMLMLEVQFLRWRVGISLMLVDIGKGWDLD